jgi:hypothetical protein
VQATPRAGERYLADARRRADAGQPRASRRELGASSGDARRRLVATRDAERGNEHAVHLEIRVGTEALAEAAHQRARGDAKHDARRDLGRDERVTEARAPETRSEDPVVSLERRVEVDARAVERWYEPEDERAREHESDRVNEDPRAGVQVEHDRPDGERE